MVVPLITLSVRINPRQERSFLPPGLFRKLPDAGAAADAEDGRRHFH
jgi:hypothetical protein